MAVPARIASPRAPTRVRLSADGRRAQLLDVAGRLVEDGGVGACTIERLAAEAGVSRTLVYQHFDNSADVLHALFDREWAWLQGRLAEGRIPGWTFEERLRTVLRAYLDAKRERGTAILSLAQAPENAGKLADVIRTYYDAARQYWMSEIMREFALDESTAGMAVPVLMGAFDAGARLVWDDENVDDDALEDIVVRIILAALHDLAGVKPQVAGRKKRGKA